VIPSSVSITAQRPALGGSALDRYGVQFFVAGLCALVGAVIFAVTRLTEIREPTIDLLLTSTPPGAAVSVDGRDLGVTTPRTLTGIAADRPHDVEFRLAGFAPCKRTVELPANPANPANPTSRAREMPVDCLLEPGPPDP
jgi:hypothetical protein